jgi:hypothetical protein
MIRMGVRNDGFLHGPPRIDMEIALFAVKPARRESYQPAAFHPFILQHWRKGICVAPDTNKKLACVCNVRLVRMFCVIRGSAFSKQTTNHTNPHEKEHETREVPNPSVTSLLRGPAFKKPTMEHGNH